MATSASQPYIARLGFQDPDRSKDRHGLACEYLFERLLELEVAPFLRNYKAFIETQKLPTLERYRDEADEKNKHRVEYYDYRSEIKRLQQEVCAFSDPNLFDAIRQELNAASRVNVPIKSGYSVIGFADTLINWHVNCDDFRGKQLAVLGEVKITRQPAEQVLQQINFYKAHLKESYTTYILTDYDCSDLQRLTQGSDVKVFRLGQRFEQWLATRTAPATPEL
jgi:hypothetical protein